MPFAVVFDISVAKMFQCCVFFNLLNNFLLFDLFYLLFFFIYKLLFFFYFFFFRKMNNTTVPEYGSLNKLYSALIECFTVILAGYLAGCTGMIKPKYGNGIKVFVWNLCLPSMVLLGMWELNFREVNWKFLSCIFIAKVTIFFLVLVITLLAYRPVNLGVAGIYGIFTTASNDFALGYPICK